jgi:imidazolonepropionase-like amidohydrolase
VSGALRDLAEARQAGVKFLAGTDVGVAFMYPGFSLHDELRLYVSHLGFSPMEALRAATHNPAEFYDIASSQGGIAPGQVADLILLDANPLENIANTRMIQSVVVAGRVWTRRLLDALMAETAKRVAELEEPGPRTDRPQ